MATATWQKVSDTIYDTIVSSIGSSLSNRVYTLDGAPQNTITSSNDMPLCKFQLITNDITSYLSCDSQEITLQVDFYVWKTQGIRALSTIADTLYDDLHRSSIVVDSIGYNITGTISGITTVEDDLNRIRQEYNIVII